MRSWRGLRTAAVMILTGVLLCITPALSAQAHDSLVSTSPSDGDVLEAMPSEISLVFSDTVLEIGNEVILTGPDGAQVSTGELSISDSTVRVPVGETSAQGTYTLAWRVVSSDGHPISGQFSFSVGYASSSSASANATTSSPTSEVAETGSETASETTSADSGDSPWQPGGWARQVAVALVGAAVGVGILILGITLGRRTSASRTNTPGDAHDPHDENARKNEQ